MEAQEVVEPVVDILVGDEVRAANTVSDFLSGKSVDIDDSIHAAYTIGSDLLMLVPGIGAAAAAVKYGSRAGKVAKAAKATKNAVVAGQRATKASIEAANKANFAKKIKATTAARKSAKASAAAAKAVNKIKKTKGLTVRRPTENRSAYDAYMADAAKWSKKQQAAKQKYKSPKRKKARKLGRFGSNVGNLDSAFQYFSQEED